MFIRPNNENLTIKEMLAIFSKILAELDTILKHNNQNYFVLKREFDSLAVQLNNIKEPAKQTHSHTVTLSYKKQYLDFINAAQSNLIELHEKLWFKKGELLAYKTSLEQLIPYEFEASLKNHINDTIDDFYKNAYELFSLLEKSNKIYQEKQDLIRILTPQVEQMIKVQARANTLEDTKEKLSSLINLVTRLSRELNSELSMLTPPILIISSQLKSLMDSTEEKSIPSMKRS